LRKRDAGVDSRWGVQGSFASTNKPTTESKQPASAWYLKSANTYFDSAILPCRRARKERLHFAMKTPANQAIMSASCSGSRASSLHLFILSVPHCYRRYIGLGFRQVG
jgi:hypothetical protein